MKISTKGRYALEAVTDLTLHAGMQFESIRGIAERRSLSENYLEQIFILLRHAGIVESVRGPQGGYRITRDPDLITAGDVLHAVEGQMAPVLCLASDDESGLCEREARCVTRKVWQTMMREMDLVLNQVTIGKLAEAVRTEQLIPVSDYII